MYEDDDEYNCSHFKGIWNKSEDINTEVEIVETLNSLII